MTIRTRSQLLSLLTEACELEHGLACSYLFAAFSLKQDMSEGGLDWRQLQRVRLWAAQIYLVAAEEMLHLAQVWNIQSAIGGTPYYLRPNFPQPSRYYPLNLPLRLEPFSLSTVELFIGFERPADIVPGGAEATSEAGQVAFRTVGELYGLVREAFDQVPNLLVGYPNRQVGQDLVDFPGLIKIQTIDDARKAVDMITEQGEGIDERHADSHFEIFRRIRREYLEELLRAESEGKAFEPVRSVVANPTAVAAPHYAASGAMPITDARTAALADCFDSIYGHMLRLLQYVFDNATDEPTLLRNFGHGAIEAMAAVIKPLGEALTLLPAGTVYERQTAGPGFVLARHVALPTEPLAAATVAAEKFAELAARLDHLAGDGMPAQLLAASRNLTRIAARFGEQVAAMREVGLEPQRGAMPDGSVGDVAT